VRSLALILAHVNKESREDSRGYSQHETHGYSKHLLRRSYTLYTSPLSEIGFSSRKTSDPRSSLQLTAKCCRLDQLYRCGQRGRVCDGKRGNSQRLKLNGKGRTTVLLIWSCQRRHMPKRMRLRRRLQKNDSYCVIQKPCTYYDSGEVHSYASQSCNAQPLWDYLSLEITISLMH